MEQSTASGRAAKRARSAQASSVGGFFTPIGAEIFDDACALSDRSATVTIDGCNSQVVNTFSSQGCTISDQIAECALSARNHGQFVNCVARLTNTLKQAGIITGEEQGQIQNCAAQANIPPGEDGRCAGKVATIMGTKRPDRLKGTRGADVMQGLSGNDSITGFKGNDTICGGGDKDHVNGGLGNDQLFGQRARDRLFGQRGRDALDGGRQIDRCNGGLGSDRAVRCEQVRNVP